MDEVFPGPPPPPPAEEDVHGSYSRLLLKYFLSEGVMCGHDLLLASASERPVDVLKVGDYRCERFSIRF